VLQVSPRVRANQNRAQTPALLKGLIFGVDGRALSPTHSRKNGRLYCYHVAQRVLKGDAAGDASIVRRVSAAETFPAKPGCVESLPWALGPQVADIRKLYSSLGIFTYDPGYEETASCESKITYSEGDAGILMYRGYPIEQLAENRDFFEICYLLMNGGLPNEAEIRKSKNDVTYHTMVHEQIRRFFYGFRRDAHPMAIMCGVVGALAAFYHDSLDINDARQREVAAFRLIAKVPAIAAMAYKYSLDQPFMYPQNKLSHAANFLYMLNTVPAEPYHVSPVLEKAVSHTDMRRGA